MIPRILAHYRIIEKLGEGAMGIVVRAEDTRLGRIVALKFLPPALRAEPAAVTRFLQEARAAARLNHPNVCTIYDIHDHDGEHFIAMELVDGVTLRRRLEELRAAGEAMSVGEALRHAQAIVSGVAAAHAVGVLHRDIKAENIMIDTSGRVRIMDFGLARLEQEQRLTRGGGVVGTVAYMAPELLRNEEGDARSDIFSLGVVLYEMLGGRLPFRGMHEAAMIYSILNEEPQALRGLRSDLPEALEAIVDRALAKDRALRFQSTAELRAALLETARLEGDASAAAPPGAELDTGCQASSATPQAPLPTSSIAPRTELRVYISTTPDDLHEEREHLAKRIFPEIRALCRERGIVFTEVDLGSTGEEGTIGAGRIRTALDEIDRCRPYFIGIAGERYGRAVELYQIHADAELIDRHGWIEDAAIDGESLVAIEARHALLNDGGHAMHGRYYFRRQRARLDADPSNGNDEGTRLAALRQRLVSAAIPIGEFRDPVSLGEMIYDDLVEIIRTDFAHLAAPTPLQRERQRQRAFSTTRRHSYIPNVVYLKRLNAFVESYDADGNGRALVIASTSGSGKSSLLAHWAHQYMRRNPEAPLVEYYIELGAGGVGHIVILRYIMEELREIAGIGDQLPESSEGIERDFARWLAAAGERKRIVLVLDGIDQLPESSLDLGWLPASIPPGVRLLVSSTPGRSLDLLERRHWERMEVEPLTEQECEAIVIRFLGEHHKRISPEQARRIASDPKCALPIFLRMMLEELRLVRRGDDLEKQIDLHLACRDTGELFQHVLERLEEEFGPRAIREVAGLLWGSREGLLESELSEITQISRTRLSSVIMALDNHLLRRNGQLSFFHDYLRNAVEERYLQDRSARRDLHLRLAAYFEEQLPASPSEVPVRVAHELPWQLHRAGESDRLAETLGSIPMFMALFTEDATVVYRYWRGLADTHDPVAICRASLDAYRTLEVEPATFLRALRALGTFHDTIGKWDHAGELFTEAAAIAAREGLPEDRAAALCGLGVVARHRSDHPAAIEYYTEAIEIRERTGNMLGATSGMDQLAYHYLCMDRHSEGIALVNRMIGIGEELNDLRTIARAHSTMSSFQNDVGDRYAAVESMERAYGIYQQLRDPATLTRVEARLGIFLINIGEFARAEEYLLRHLRYCDEIGDRTGLVYVYGYLGRLYLSMGDYTTAMRFAARHLEISTELGRTAGLLRAYSHIGRIHQMRGDHDAALAAFGSALAAARTLKSPEAMAVVLLNMGDTAVARALDDDSGDRESVADELRQARLWLSESMEHWPQPEGDKDPYRYDRFASRIQLAAIEALLGEDPARSRLHALVEEATSDQNNSFLHYMIWKLLDPSDIDRREKHRSISLECYHRLYRWIPEYDYVLRIEELEGKDEG